MVKEDLTEVVFLFVDKTVAMNFDSCQVDFNRIVISQGLDSIRSLSIQGNSDLVNV